MITNQRLVVPMAGLVAITGATKFILYELVAYVWALYSRNMVNDHQSEIGSSSGWTRRDHWSYKIYFV